MHDLRVAPLPTAGCADCLRDDATKGLGHKPTGHQWTKVVIVIGDAAVPLPPIACWNMAERRRRKIADLIEHDRVVQYLPTLNLADLLGPYALDEVVVLLDSGYEDSEIIKTIASRD